MIELVVSLVSSTFLMLLGIRHIFLARQLRLLQEENFDLRFQLEVLQARGVAVHPFTGNSP